MLTYATYLVLTEAKVSPKALHCCKTYEALINSGVTNVLWFCTLPTSPRLPDNPLDSISKTTYRPLENEIVDLFMFFQIDHKL